MKKNETVDVSQNLDSFKKTALVLLPLRELHSSIEQTFGPMAAEVLEVLTKCVLDDEIVSGAVPLGFKRLHRLFINQGMSHQEARQLESLYYGKLYKELDRHLPGWENKVDNSALEYWMHDLCTLAVCFRAV